MKRRTHPMKRSGIAPYTKHQKAPYPMPEWVRKASKPPKDIVAGLVAAHMAAFGRVICPRLEAWR